MTRTAIAAVLLLLTGCAMLPLDNEAPDVPELQSDGVRHVNFGVPVTVICTDPDGDRVAVRFRAVNGPAQLEFAWSTYLASGDTTVFYLDLPLGPWRLEAWARDELDETGARGSLELTVTN